MKEETIFASSARIASANSNDFDLPPEASGVLLFLNVSASSGTTPTLDVKVQSKDPISGAYIDIGGAAFTQKTGTTGLSRLLIHPLGTAAANVVVAQHTGKTYRLVATIAGTTPSFTFSVAASYTK